MYTRQTKYANKLSGHNTVNTLPGRKISNQLVFTSLHLKKLATGLRPDATICIFSKLK